MRILFFFAIFILSTPLQAETWECKPPIDQVPWSAIELTAVAGEASQAQVQIGSKSYVAAYQLDGTTNIWLLEPNAEYGFNGGVLKIDVRGNGSLKRELVMNGVIVHADGTYTCRRVPTAAG